MRRTMCDAGFHDGCAGCGCVCHKNKEAVVKSAWCSAEMHGDCVEVTDGFRCYCECHNEYFLRTSWCSTSKHGSCTGVVLSGDGFRSYCACHCHIEKGEEAVVSEMQNDPVNHPSHYTSDPSGVECITVTRHRNFNIGNAIKYLWRAGLKVDPEKTPVSKQIEDLEKARWYIADEIERLRGEGREAENDGG